MKILALEFSSPQRSAAVVDGASRPRPLCLGEAIETGGRSTDALGLVERALRQARIDRAQIDCLAIGLGPGSYNGMRLAIALAQGWQLARPVKVVGISSVNCVAAEAQGQGICGRVEIVIDAQRNEVYLAGYEVSPRACLEAEPLHLTSLAEAGERRKKGGLLVGPEITRWFPDGRVLFPRAATLGCLAAAQTSFVAAQDLQPIYLRETRFVKAPPARFRE